MHEKTMKILKNPIYWCKNHWKIHILWQNLKIQILKIDFFEFQKWKNEKSRPITWRWWW